MERLNRRDLSQLLEFSQGLLALRNAQGFREYLLQNLRVLVSSEFSSYGEIDPNRPPGEMGNTWLEPIGLNPPGYTEWSQNLLASEPTWLHFQKSATNKALAHSDFYSDRQYRETEHYALYNEIGGPIRDGIVAYQAHSSGLLLHFAAIRGKRYSARDRLIFEAISPHVFQARANVKAFADCSAEIHQLHSAIERSGRAAVILSADLQITYSSELAAVWMNEYFGRSHGGALPEQLNSWLREQLGRMRIVDDVAAPIGTLKLAGETGTIVIRLASLPNGWLLSLEKEAPRLQIRALQLLPITKREAEVLFYVANGKTNPEIAVILGVSRLTVKKHLEHIFQSLSVETRTAAAAVALQLVSDVPR